MAERAIDAATLRRGVELIASIPVDAYELVFPDGQRFDIESRRTRLRTLVASLSDWHRLDELEVQLRLTFGADSAFGALLMALAQRRPEVDQLMALVREKCNLPIDEEMVELWSRCLAEVSPTRETKLEVDPSVVPRAFFSIGRPSELREKIAAYITWIKPRLERRQALRGQTRFPAEAVGVARVLSWSRASATAALSFSERSLIRSIVRLAGWFSQREEADMFAQAAGLDSQGALASGTVGRDVRGREELQNVAAILDELRQVVRVAGHLSGADSAVTRALRAYKLGREVMGPSGDGLSAKTPELRLQQHLCRFLVEREIPAMGTKFGRSEADVRSEDSWGVHVVEVKRFDVAPSEKSIQAWAVQLLSYMDHEPMRRFGVLALFNFSDVPIFAPGSFFRGRLCVLPINLCARSPSQRKGSLLVEEPLTDQELFRVLRIGLGGSGARAPRRTRKVAPVRSAPGRRKSR